MELIKRIKINNQIYYLKGSEYFQFSSGYFDDNDEIEKCEYLTDPKKTN